ncbi:protein gvpK [Halobacteriales archaeon QS_5_70_15]|nr:MAG: protein gvpK [Halobacteriales archaeon QS_5_70_15]
MTRIDLDGEDAADGLIALVVTIVELLLEVMEREAVRRMESGQLTDEETERLGAQLASIEAEIDRIKADAGIDEDVEDLRARLHDLVDGAVSSLAVDDETLVGGGRR